MPDAFKPHTAFVLTAGLGTRLRPHTDTLPKPLVPVTGKPLLDYIFDHLKAAGVTRITLNLHHKPDKIREYLETRHDFAITQSFEAELLDTGGGIKNALDSLGSDPFYIINGDAFWLDGASGSALNNLAAFFDPSRMDIALLLQPVSHMQLTQGVGDYDVDQSGKAIRRPNKDGKLMFAGIRICHPRVFENAPDGKFSFLQLMDAAEQSGRLYALVHDGDWHHISTPQDLEAVNQAMQER